MVEAKEISWLTWLRRKLPVVKSMTPVATLLERSAGSALSATEEILRCADPAAAVVASQWMIGDTAAALTTTMFYRNLVSGAEGPAALRDAQAWLRDTTNAEKAAFLHPATGRSGLPPAVARPLWRWLMQAPDGRSFLMPSQWAAMTYTGV